MPRISQAYEICIFVSNELFTIAIQFVSDSCSGFDGEKTKPGLRSVFAQSVDVGFPLKIIAVP